MEDHQTHAAPSASPEQDQYERPVVREQRPDPRQARTGAPPAGSQPSSPAVAPAPPSEVETGVEEKRPADEMSGTTFQRRWEAVQSLFVTRGGRGRRRMAGSAVQSGLGDR